MKRLAILALPVVFVLLACDDKPKTDDTAKSAAASASTPPPAASSAAPTASASAAPSASASAAPVGSSLAPSKDVQITIKDPTTESSAIAKALVDGAVTLYLPETAGTSWTIPNADKTLGKPKEQTIPGFVGTTPAHQWVWQIKAPTGQRKVVLVNKKKTPAPGDKDTTFTLTIDIK